MEVLQGGGSGPTTGSYTFIGAERTIRVNPSNNTFTPVVNVTAMSVTYGVTFTWTVTAKTWDNDGGPAALTQKVGEVDQICATDHVQDFRTVQNQGPSQILYNYGVVTVGTDDGAIEDEVQIRMDSLNTPAAFAAIAACWARLVAAGAPADGS